MLSALSFLLISASQPRDIPCGELAQPFLGSAVLVAFDLCVRSKVDETPIFERQQETGAIVRIPLMVAFHAQPWGNLSGAGVPPVAIAYTVSAFIANYVVDYVGLSRNQIIGATALGGFGYLVSGTGCLVSDRVERMRVLGYARLLAAVSAICLFPILNLGTVFAYFLVLRLTFAITGRAYGAIGAFLPEQFKTRYRMTATGVP
ncbi:hypothetical protein K7711_19575 [Nocardia sp. CA2R105]|uniref:hypothetical protein n=1 Tax=Nocardia coffeae TaxID=2873381 RepID=UPI001CA727B2|nr:hypothetical protein [Nocardia coffeae]MBY8858687.1 hypothetical protein [Nocardia coffeae]